jgi:protein-S-isoprenylcysteine O-methyltransferase Ste14
MALAVYFFIYFSVAFLLRSWLIYQKTGINPVVLTSRDDAYGYVGLSFKVVTACVAIFVALQAIYPDMLQNTGLISVLQGERVNIVGWLLLLVSLLWTIIAQWQMGSSWRIGIDERNRTQLVENGLFALSRNPIFLAMRINLLGLVLVRPHAITLTLFVAGDLLMQVQVRLEEAHLSAQHGESYAAYLKKVRRWL